MLGIDKTALIIFLCALTPTALIGTVAFHQTTKLAANHSVTLTREETREELSNVLVCTSSAESAVRAFVITGKDDFLQPYLSAHSDLVRHFAKLRSLTAANPIEQRHLTDLELAVNERIDSLSDVVVLRKRKGFEAAESFIATGKSTQLMQRIRKEIDQYESAMASQTALADPSKERTPAHALYILLGFALIIVLCNWFFSRLR